MKRTLAPLAALLLPAACALAQDEGDRSVSLAEAFFLQRNGRTGSIELFGTLIIWVLIAASAASVALLVKRARENGRQRFIAQATKDECAALLREGEIDRAARRAAQDDSDLGSMLASSIPELHESHEAAIRALEVAADASSSARLRRIEPLNIIGGVAPMLGLFGTVYGMILAFREIVAAGGAPDPVGLAAGIGTALTTTFWGLIVAIPALIGFGVLRNAIDAYTADAEQAAESVLARHTPSEDE